MPKSMVIDSATSLHWVSKVMPVTRSYRRRDAGRKRRIQAHLRPCVLGVGQGFKKNTMLSSCPINNHLSRTASLKVSTKQFPFVTALPGFAAELFL